MDLSGDGADSFELRLENSDESNIPVFARELINEFSTTDRHRRKATFGTLAFFDGAYFMI